MKDNKMRKQYAAESRRRRLLELEDMKKNPSQLQPGFLHPAYQGTIAEAPGRKSGDRD